MLWSLLHLPFLLSLLLLLRCVTNSLAATEAIISADIYVAIINSVDTNVFGLVAQGVSVEEYVSALKSAESYESLVSFAGSLGVDLNREYALRSKSLDLSIEVDALILSKALWRHTSLRRTGTSKSLSNYMPAVYTRFWHESLPTMTTIQA